MEDSVADGHSHPWKVATEKRKAWARSRDSWQTSESVEVATEEQHSPGSREEKLPVSVDSGGIPNENIAIWLKDCRTPLGASLDDQNNSALKGIIKNGGSFEDDLSLGAEANHLRPTSNETGFGMLAKDKRNRFHQKGRSMNSTGSGKSSTTLSSVSELLDLYEEDPEEILYNLGFGTEEPDIASKIPSRFFNSTSGASGIDIKVYLDAQIQRMEVENPNYALTSRFRQIEVLTTVANAFSSLYSQVSGLPLQKIGNGATLPSENEGKDVPPFKRSSSALNAASKLKKTISRRSLHGAPQPGTEVNSSTAPASTGKENAVLGTEANTGMAEERNEQKLQKPLRKKDSPSLETVKEEAPVGLCSTSENGYLEFNKVSRIEGHGKVGLSDESSFTDSSLRNKDLNASTDGDLETNYEHKPAVTSTPDKEPSSQFQNPLLAHVFSLQKDSFEMEEIQSNEGEATSGTTNSRTEQLLRAVSQHSDSSGFAEDPSVDCASNTHLQVQESYDSCDSETTVTSNAEDIRTPLAVDQPVFWKLQGNEDVLKPSTEDAASLSLSSLDKDGLHITDAEAVSVDETPSLEGPNIRETESASEDEIPPYVLHQIPKAVSHPTEGQDITAGEQDLPSTSDKVRFALCRAQLKACNVSDGAACMKVKARDLLQEKRELDLRRQSFLSSRRYPLIRSRSLPTSLLSPIRVVSSVKVRLSPGSETQCSPPSFTYKYTPEEDESIAEEEEQSTCTSTLFISPASQKKEPDRSASGFESGLDGGCNRIHSYPMHMPLHMSQSACSLHSINSSCYDRPLSEHMRTRSTSSVPNLPPYGSQEFPYSYSCPYPPRPVMYPTRPLHPPSTIEMQLRRVLHEIRNTVQNLAQNPALRGNESPASMYSSQRSVLPLYENTFQELQIMRKSLNVFGTQMMDLELSMMRQQIEVYPHLTEEERQEADQLQSLRTAVRQELQELELQLEDRLLTLEGQIRSSHHASLYRPQMTFGMQGSRSMDCLSCSSPVNVIEPVTELLREQLHLKSELGYEDPAGDYCSSATPSLASEASSGASSPSRKNRNPSFPPRQTQKPHAPDWSSQKMECYRASVSLTPSAPVRPRMENHVHEDEESVVENLRVELAAAASLSAEKTRRHMSDSPELQQVLKEIKETLAEEIRREIVNELVAAVSSPSRSPVIKREMS